MPITNLYSFISSGHEGNHEISTSEIKYTADAEADD